VVNFRMSGTILGVMIFLIDEVRIFRLT